MRVSDFSIVFLLLFQWNGKYAWLAERCHGEQGVQTLCAVSCRVTRNVTHKS